MFNKYLLEKQCLIHVCKFHNVHIEMLYHVCIKHIFVSEWKICCVGRVTLRTWG